MEPIFFDDIERNNPRKYFFSELRTDHCVRLLSSNLGRQRLVVGRWDFTWCSPNHPTNFKQGIHPLPLPPNQPVLPPHMPIPLPPSTITCCPPSSPPPFPLLRSSSPPFSDFLSPQEISCMVLLHEALSYPKKFSSFFHPEKIFFFTLYAALLVRREEYGEGGYRGSGWLVANVAAAATTTVVIWCQTLIIPYILLWSAMTSFALLLLG